MNGLSFQVRAGEILGVAGVQGNGQTELCEALMGLRPVAGGTISVEGHDLTHASPRARLRAGIAYVPEDRTDDGLVGPFSVAENLILDMYDRAPYSSGINLNLASIRENAAARIEEFDIRTGSAATAAGTLSGGNQQKVILAREVGREHKVLSPASPPAASMSAPSSSCTSGSSSSATTASRWSSSPLSSTRSTRSPTGSRSSTRARSPASGTLTCPPPSSAG